MVFTFPGEVPNTAISKISTASENAGMGIPLMKWQMPQGKKPSLYSCLFSEMSIHFPTLSIFYFGTLELKQWFLMTLWVSRGMDLHLLSMKNEGA